MALVTTLLAVALGLQLNPLPAKPTDGDDVAVLETEAGRIVMMFYPQVAPNTVANFKDLVSSGFYNGTRFHRCIPGFMIQGGDPYSKYTSKYDQWGTGGHMVDGQEKTIKAEFNDLSHKRGIVSMARSSDPDSASSQFFVVTQDAPSLDHQYTAFGRVVQGMDAADRIVVTGQGEDNGQVRSDNAVVVKSVKIGTWPLKVGAW